MMFEILLISSLYFHYHRISIVEAWQEQGYVQVKEGEYPYSVALIDLTRFPSIIEKYYCGGALITNKHVLTTQSCIHGKTLDDIKVMIGSSWLTSPSMKCHDIAYSYSYAEWKISNHLETPTIDIAILTLKQATGIAPIILSTTNTKYLSGLLHVVMASWGESVVNPHIMKRASVTILKKPECKDRALKRNPLQNTILEFLVDNYIIMCNSQDPSVLRTLKNHGSPLIHHASKGPIYLVGIHQGVLNDSKTNLFIPIDTCRSFIKNATGL